MQERQITSRIIQIAERAGGIVNFFGTPPTEGLIVMPDTDGATAFVDGLPLCTLTDGLFRAPVFVCTGEGEGFAEESDAAVRKWLAAEFIPGLVDEGWQLESVTRGERGWYCVSIRFEFESDEAAVEVLRRAAERGPAVFLGPERLLEWATVVEEEAH